MFSRDRPDTAVNFETYVHVENLNASLVIIEGFVAFVTICRQLTCTINPRYRLRFQEPSR